MPIKQPDMTLTPRLIRLALYCAGEELRARHAGKARVLPWNAELIRALQHQLALSESGHESGCDTEESEIWISAREAATQLGLSKRQTQRLATDHDGRLIDDRWVFPANAVADYAKGRSDGRRTA